MFLLPALRHASPAQYVTPLRLFFCSSLSLLVCMSLLLRSFVDHFSRILSSISNSSNVAIFYRVILLGQTSFSVSLIDVVIPVLSFSRLIHCFPIPLYWISSLIMPFPSLISSVVAIRWLSSRERPSPCLCRHSDSADDGRGAARYPPSLKWSPECRTSWIFMPVTSVAQEGFLSFQELLAEDFLSGLVPRDVFWLHVFSFLFVSWVRFRFRRVHSCEASENAFVFQYYDKNISPCLKWYFSAGC